MSWIKVDGRFFMGTTVLDAGPLGGLLYLYSLTYCMDHNLNRMPHIVIDKLWAGFYGEQETSEAIAALVAAGVWVEEPDGWSIVHEWVEDDVVIERPNEWGCADVIAAARINATQCAYCGATDRLEVDHIVPRSRGGCSRPANLQILCRPCNTRKRSAIPWGALEGGRTP